MPPVPVRYRSADEDSARWDAFSYRPGDIVISTRSKSGTTWMQMICALLVFQTPELPTPLADLSPWLDWRAIGLDDVLSRLGHQHHRRFLKTHTPLDGIPLDPSATYIVVARHPLDAAVSLYHQGDNLDRARLRRLSGDAMAPASATLHAPPARPALSEWLAAWIDREVAPGDDLDSLPGVMWHLSDAWARRDAGNVLLVRYEDLVADLDGQMRRVAARLDIDVPAPIWPDLVAAAGFEPMRARAGELVPDPVGVLKDRAAFFRRGRPGARAEVLSAAQVDHYRDRAGRLAPPDLLSWLHGRPRDPGSPV